MQKFHVTIPAEVGDTSHPQSISFHLNVVLEKFIVLTLVRTVHTHSTAQVTAKLSNKYLSDCFLGYLLSIYRNVMYKPNR